MAGKLNKLELIGCLEGILGEGIRSVVFMDLSVDDAERYAEFVKDEDRYSVAVDGPSLSNSSLKEESCFSVKFSYVEGASNA